MKSQHSLLQGALASTKFIKEFDSRALEIAGLIKSCHNQKLITTIFGNGGSAADAQHWAAELVCTYKDRSRHPYAALALTTDTSILTAWSNDFEYSTIFDRQLEAFSGVNGLSIGLSTSGTSVNVLNGLKTAKRFGARTVLISGCACDHQSVFDLHMQLPATETPLIQTLTQMLYHEVCQNLETK